MAELFLPSGSWRYINMDFFNAIFQGIIQGLTEFLPVSSSGHLAIYQHITGMQENNLFFSVMLHIGTLSAVLAIYFKTVLKLFSSLISIFKKLIHRDFVWKDMTPEENLAMMIIIGLIPLFLLFMPIPATDMKVKDIADKFALDGYFLAVGIYHGDDIGLDIDAFGYHLAEFFEVHFHVLILFYSVSLAQMQFILTHTCPVLFHISKYDIPARYSSW